MGIAKITRNYQVTLPKDIREIEGLKEGDVVVFTIYDSRIILTKSAKDIISLSAGIWKGMKETGAEYTKRIRVGWDGRVAK